MQDLGMFSTEFYLSYLGFALKLVPFSLNLGYPANILNMFKTY